MRPTRPAALLVAVVTLTGCQSRFEPITIDSTASPTVSQSTAVAEPVTTLDPVADQLVAESALLRLDDFPDGWTERPPDVDDYLEEADVEEGRDEARRCMEAVSVPPEADTVSASTGEFVSPDGYTIEHEVTIGSLEDAEARMDLLADPVTHDCLGAAITWLTQARLADFDVESMTVTFGEVTVERLDLAAVGDEHVALRIWLPAKMHNTEFDVSVDLDVYIDQVDVRVGRARSTLTMMKSLTPLPVADIDHHVAIAALRMATALANR